MREWAVPLVLGLLTFGGLLGLVRLAPSQQEDPPLVPAFAAPVVDPAAPGRLLVLQAQGKGALLLEVPVDAPGPVTARGQVVATAELADHGPRLGDAGFQGALLAFHAFAADGRLLASTAPEALGAFARHGDFQPAAPVALYLGERSPANGTRALPPALAALAPALRDALAGQPEGGVAVVRVEEGLPAELYGTVTVALQVVRLLPAA